MTKERRLGRGLAALLGATSEDEQEGLSDAVTSSPSGGVRVPVGTAHSPTEPASGESSDLLFLDVGEIDGNPFQPRRDFSEAEIASLAESLKEHDMLQPVLVRRLGTRFQLISGERRLRAAVRAGWAKVPARVRQADDRLVAELAIVENLQRKDLNPIEKAMSFKRYLDEHRCTQEDLAQRLKIDRSTISNLMRLLELPHEVLDAIRSNAISAGHARALLPLSDEQEQIDFCRRIQQEGLSVRDTERLTQEQLAATADEPEPLAEAAPTRTKRTRSDQVASLEQELKMALGTRVEIRQTSSGRGRIIVHFHSHEEFERLCEALTGTKGTGRQPLAA